MRSCSCLACLSIFASAVQCPHALPVPERCSGLGYVGQNDFTACWKVRQDWPGQLTNQPCVWNSCAKWSNHLASGKMTPLDQSQTTCASCRGKHAKNSTVVVIKFTLKTTHWYRVNFFLTHRTLWDDRKFFPSCHISHWWTTGTASFIDASHTGVQH